MNRKSKYIINFAIVGCGLISSFHISAIEAIPDAFLLGVYDNNSDIAEKTASEHNVRAYSSYEELLADNDVDVVCICTPSYLHGEMSIAAAIAGKSVLVEKPLALSLEQCDVLSDIASEKKVQIGVVSQLRFSNAFSKVKKVLNDGLLGRITRMDLYMKYYRTQAYYDNGGWRGKSATDGGGALMNQGIHGVDLLRYLGGPLKTVSAFSATLSHDIEVEDTLSAILSFQNGAIGVIEASTADWPGQPRRIEINGDSGFIVIQEDQIVEWKVEGEELLDFSSNNTSAAGGFNDPSKISNVGHVRQIENFIASLKGDAELEVGIAEGREALRLILAAYDSSQTGSVINMNEYGKRSI